MTSMAHLSVLTEPDSITTPFVPARRHGDARLLLIDDAPVHRLHL
jgi:hypothetical protein